MATFFLLLLVMSLQTLGEGAGTLLIRLVHFENPDGYGINGHICEGKNFMKHLINDECDHMFKLCLETSPEAGCNLGSMQTPAIHDQRIITFGNKIGHLSNPIDFPYKRNSFHFKVMVLDEDTNDADRVGFFAKEIENVPVGTNGSKPRPRKVALYTYHNKLKMNLEVWATCNQHYYGKTCEVKCIPQNSSTAGFYTCDQHSGEKICTKPYRGKDCLNKDFCQSHFCKNGAKCISTASGYACSCLTGYHGRYCEIKEHPCKRIRCENSGVCVTNGSQPICNCKRGFVGRYCEQDLDECFQGRPCHNNATCKNYFGGYHCICSHGFRGIYCENKIKQKSTESIHIPFAESIQSLTKKDPMIPQWSYFVAGGAVLVAIFCITLLIVLHKRRKVLVIKARDSQVISYRANLPSAMEENVYIADNESEGTLYEDIDRQLDEAGSLSEDEIESDFDNRAYGIHSSNEFQITGKDAIV